MNLVVPMAGFGQRFLDAGYGQPKYMIEVCGKTLFSWSVSSMDALKEDIARYVFVVRKENRATEFIKGELSGLGINLSKVSIVEINEPTDGQATTALVALDWCLPECGLLVYNIDTYIEPGALTRDMFNADGCIPCFDAEGNHWSFVLEDGDGRVIEVAEKRRISSHCSIGAYWFASPLAYRDAYEGTFSHEGVPETGERYIAPMYNHMIRRGLDVRMETVEAAAVHVMGTPVELEAFRSEWWANSKGSA